MFFAATESEIVGRKTLLLTLSDARVNMSPAEFRERLRGHMVANPTLTLRSVAQALGVTRQCVSQMVGRLDRPSCAHPDRPAPRKDAARHALPQLVKRVKSGEPAEKAAAALGISLPQAIRLGFRSKVARPPHGTQSRIDSGCNCWRCRKSGGIALPRGPKSGPIRQAAVLDWLAWSDPDEGTKLTQTVIGKLAGVAQGAVSRIFRAQEGLG